MNAILKKLTQFHIRSINGKYVGNQFIKLPNGTNQEIMVYSGDKTLFIGQCTIYGTIIVHEAMLANRTTLNYVLLHEMAHKRQWWVFFIIPLILVMIIGMISLFLFLIYLVLSLIKFNLNNFLTALLGVLISSFLILLFCAFSWMLEFNAEFKAIKEMGLQSYLDTRMQLPKPLKLSPSQKLIIRMTHPTTNITVKLWKWFNRN